MISTSPAPATGTDLDHDVQVPPSVPPQRRQPRHNEREVGQRTTPSSAFTVELRQQLTAARGLLGQARNDGDSFLIEIAYARLRELGDLRRRHYERPPSAVPC